MHNTAASHHHVMLLVSFATTVLWYRSVYLTSRIQLFLLSTLIFLSPI